MRPTSRITVARLAPVLVAAALLSGATAAWAQKAISGAELAPADAGVFIQIDNIAQLRGDWKVDPLGVYLRQQLPMFEGDDSWEKVQEMMQMDSDTLIDTYFGETVVLIAKSMGGGQANVRVDLADPEPAQLVDEAAEPEPGPAPARRPGSGLVAEEPDVEDDEPAPARPEPTDADAPGDEPGEPDPGVSAVANASSNAPGVVLMKVALDDQALAQQRLQLKPILEGAGPFKLFHTEDGEAIMAFGPEWMAMGDARHESYIRHVLKRIGNDAEPSLATQPDFQTWTGRLPDPRFATLYAAEKSRKEFHAVGLTRDGRNLGVDYAGHSPGMRRVFEMMGKGASLDFGPLPKQTIAALSLNLMDRDIDPRRTAFLDQMLAPRTFAGDVMPKLTGPIVLAMGQVPADRVQPATDMPTPAFAAAIRMSDPAVAADLDRMIDSMMLFVNLAASQRGVEAPLVETVHYENHIYRAVNLGPLVAAATNRPDRAGMVKLAYGRIGDWYVVTSHEVFFQQALDAKDNPEDALANDEALKAMPITKQELPIVTGFVKTQRLASMLTLVEMALSTEFPGAADQASQKDPDSPMGNVIKAVRTMSTVLNHHVSITMQAHKGTGSGDYIEARLDFIRREKR